MVRDEGQKLARVVVCTPRDQYFTAVDRKAHNILEAPSREEAIAQHDALKRLLGGCGCEVIDAPELPRHPNSVFCRDAALCTPRGFIRLRMGLPAREGEERWLAEILTSLNVPCAGCISEPGTVEGGDVILAGNVAFVGLSSRTNPEGARQVSALLRSVGYEIRTARVSVSHLHLGGGMSVVAPGRVLCCRGEFGDGFFRGFDRIPVSHLGPGSGNVICLAPNQVIADSSGPPETIRELERSGVKVHALNLSEFRKGAGGPTCLILPVARSLREPAQDPDEHLG